MIQQVTITAESTVSLKPRLHAAIRNEIKLVEHGIERTREQLAAFEKQYGMTSDDFLRRFQSGEIAETLDLIDWRMEIEALRMLQSEYQMLHEARID